MRKPNPTGLELLRQEEEAAAARAQPPRVGKPVDLWGTEVRAVDAGGRLYLPGPLGQPGAELVLELQPAGGLAVYRAEDWRARPGPWSERALRQMQWPQVDRALGARARFTTVDSRGRIALPAPFREASGIQGAAVIVGRGDHLEIWAQERYGEAEKRGIMGNQGDRSWT